MSTPSRTEGAAFYPVYLDLRERACLVVGGGAIATGKARALVEAGARVTLVAPVAERVIKEWHLAGRITWHAREVEDSDLAGQFVVIAATDDRELNARLYRIADSAGQIANAVDDLDHCNFIAPAVVRSGGVQVAVSTGGRSPALAKVLRDRIAREILTPGVARLAELLGLWRQRVKSAVDSYRRRQSFWERVLEGPIPALLEEGRDDEAERVMSESLEDAKAQERRVG